MKVRSNKISDIIKYYNSLLSTKFSDKESSYLIRILIEEFIGIKRSEISLNFDKRISESEMLKIHFGIKDLLTDKPLEYIINKATFLDWEFKINEHTLIPRPETEELTIHISKSCKSQTNKIRILDIGTGSGCIAISLKKLINSDVTAIDISKKALNVAEYNAKKNDTLIQFKETNILNESEWDSMSQQYDIIVSNPPYVRMKEKEIMSNNVLNHEPHSALFVEDNNPLVFYKAIAKYSLKHLKPKGILWLEINEYLTIELKDVLDKFFNSIEFIKDFKGNYRFCKAQF